MAKNAGKCSPITLLDVRRCLWRLRY